MLLRSFESFEKIENGYLIHGDAADVKLVFMTDDIIRIRVHFDKGTPMEEESYTLVTTAWEDRMDTLLKDERTRITDYVRPWEDGDVHALPNAGNEPIMRYILRGRAWRGEE